MKICFRTKDCSKSTVHLADEEGAVCFVPIPRVDLQSVIMAFPGQTHLLF